MLGGRCPLPDDRRSKRSVSIDATPNRCRCNVHCTVRPDPVSRVLLETSPSAVAGPHGVCRCPPGSARGSAGVPAGGRLTRLFDPCHRRGAQAPPPRVQGLVPSSDLPQTAEATGGVVSRSGVSVCGSADTGTRPTTHPVSLMRHLRFTALNSAFGFRTPKMPGEPIRVQPGRARKPASADRDRPPGGRHSARRPDDLPVAIRLDDLLASFRWHLRVAAGAPPAPGQPGGPRRRGPDAAGAALERREADRAFQAAICWETAEGVYHSLPCGHGERPGVQHRGEGGQARGSSTVRFLRPAPRRRWAGLPSPGEAGPSGHTVNFTPCARGSSPE